jgi:putative nucleotidyltransferase with HDIG domain
MNPQEPLLMTVRALMQVLDASDPATRGHSLRVSRYALRVARELGVPAGDYSAIELGSLLHDIGRSAALHDVLHQPRPLDAGERAVIQTHPSIGWEILKDIPGMKDAAEIVLSHHERPDGRGYPRQLSGDQVPVGARIVMV